MRLLLVEDNPRLGDATRAALAGAGCSVDLFATAEEGWLAWRMVAYDAVILDIMLAGPGGSEGESGLHLLRRGRAAGLATPVLLLTALGSIDQRVQGLDAGADDYLVKPFAMEELVARLRALARRPQILTEDVIRFGDVAYDVTAKEVSVGESAIALSRGESIVLERFLRAPERVITRAQLGDSLHSLDQDYTDNSIQVHIHRVRAKLAELGAGVSIRTLRGLGYMVTLSPRK